MLDFIEWILCLTRKKPSLEGWILGLWDVIDESCADDTLLFAVFHVNGILVIDIDLISSGVGIDSHVGGVDDADAAVMAFFVAVERVAGSRNDVDWFDLRIIGGFKPEFAFDVETVIPFA